MPLYHGAAPYCRITQVTPESRGSGSTTAMTLDTSVVQVGGTFWASSPNPTRVTVPVSGLYDVKAWVTFAASAAGSFRQVFVLKNSSTGTRFAPNLVCPTGTTQIIIIGGSDSMVLVAGDFLEIVAVQDSGGALLTSTGGGVTPCAYLEVYKVPNT